MMLLQSLSTLIEVVSYHLITEMGSLKSYTSILNFQWLDHAPLEIVPGNLTWARDTVVVVLTA